MTIRLLSLALLAQLALTLYLYWPADTAREARETLLPVEASALSEITVSDGTSSVTLTRSGESWLSGDGLPADPTRVTALLQALTQQDPGFAVATSDTAAKRFEVAEESHQRRVALSGSGGEELVYLGTSPSFRKLHARRAGEETIFLLELNSYDVPTAAESWLDRSLAAITNVTALAIADREFALAEDQWLDADGETVDAAALETLVQALSRLQVTGIANAEDQVLAAAGEEKLALSARRGNGSEVSLTLREKDERYFLRSSAYEPLFTISAYDAERLLDAGNRLTATEASQETASESSESGEGG